MRTLITRVCRSANALLEHDREMMTRRFPGTGPSSCCRRREEQAQIRTHLRKIRTFSGGAAPSRESLDALQSVTDTSLFSFLPWWMRVRSPLTGEALRVSQVPAVIATAFVSPGAMEAAAAAHKIRKKSRMLRSIGAPQYLRREEPTFPLRLQVAGLDDTNEYLRQKRRLHKGQITVRCQVSMVVPVAAQEGRELLSRLRLRRRERRYGYTAMLTKAALFANGHKALTDARRALVFKHATRRQRKRAVGRCAELEMALPHRRAGLCGTAVISGSCTAGRCTLLQLLTWHQDQGLDASQAPPKSRG